MTDKTPNSPRPADSSFAIEALENRLLLSASPLGQVSHLTSALQPNLVVLADAGHAQTASLANSATAGGAASNGLFEGVVLADLSPVSPVPAASAPALAPVAETAAPAVQATVAVTTSATGSSEVKLTYLADATTPPPAAPATNNSVTTQLVTTLKTGQGPPATTTHAQAVTPPATGTTPSSSPLSTLTQTSGDTLTVTIGGTATTDYTQVQVTGLATLAGTLAVTFANNFKPEVGDVFDVITFGSVSGKFAHLTGVFGFGDGKVYLEVVQKADRIQLVARSFSVGTDNFVFNLAGDSFKQSMGEFLSFSYLALSSITVTGTLDLGSFAQIAGSFT